MVRQRVALFRTSDSLTLYHVYTIYIAYSLSPDYSLLDEVSSFSID